jgi:hypothetical protein
MFLGRLLKIRQRGLHFLARYCSLFINDELIYCYAVMSVASGTLTSYDTQVESRKNLKSFGYITVLL